MLNTKSNIVCGFDTILCDLEVGIGGELVLTQSISDIISADEDCGEWVPHFVRGNVNELVLLALRLFGFSQSLLLQTLGPFQVRDIGN